MSNGDQLTQDSQHIAPSSCDPIIFDNIREEDLMTALSSTKHCKKFNCLHAEKKKMMSNLLSKEKEITEKLTSHTHK